ncbi:phosphatase PAP2 family protein [Deferribacteraceae bacterium V6Fe1]|nr:phosphatase PAP2 family protein [Deferribacteraceae bacterium V6Fe1]
MEEFVKNAIISISNHQALIYVISFLMSFAESFAFIGIIIPGAIITVTTGFLASKGILNVWILIAVSVAGAIIADVASYYLAKYYGNKIQNSKIYKKIEKYIELGKVFFQKHGGKSVFFGRFVGPVRPVVPFLAGLMKMEEIKFNFYAVISGILWGILYIGGGYLFGASWHYVEEVFGKLSLLFISLILLVYIIIKVSKILFKFISKLIKILILSTQDEKIEPFIIKLIKNKFPQVFEIIKKRLNPKRETGLVLTTGIIFAMLFAYIFFGIVEDIIFNDPLVSFDINLFYMLQSFHSFFVNIVFIFFTELGSQIPVIIFFITGLIILFFNKKNRELIFYIINFSGGLLFLGALKYAFNRERPNAIYHFFNELTPSFPSGHAFTSFILYGFAGYLIFKFFKKKFLRNTYMILAITFAIFIGLSRIYLGVHWFSDVVGAYVLGMLWLSVVITAYEYYNIKLQIRELSESENSVKSILCSLILILAISVNFAYSYFKTEGVLKEKTEIIGVKYEHLSNNLLESFQNGKLKLFSSDIFGTDKKPVSAVFIGDINLFEHVLINSGFREYERKSAKKIGQTINSYLKNDIKYLPVFYDFYDNRPQDYVFVYLFDNNKSLPRIVIKLWDTHKIFENNNVYVISIVKEIGFKKIGDKITIPIVDYEASSVNVYNDIKKILSEKINIEELQISTPTKFKYNDRESYFDGKILELKFSSSNHIVNTK